MKSWNETHKVKGFRVQTRACICNDSSCKHPSVAPPRGSNRNKSILSGTASRFPPPPEPLHSAQRRLRVAGTSLHDRGIMRMYAGANPKPEGAVGAWL